MSDHFMDAFSTGKLCSGRISIKLLLYNTFSENIRKESPEMNTAQSTKGNGAILACYCSSTIMCRRNGYYVDPNQTDS